MRRKSFTLIAFAAMLVLAGCTGGGTTTSATTTTAGSTTTADTGPGGETTTVTSGPATTEAVPSADQLQQQTIAAMAAVSEYHATQNGSLHQQSNNLNRTATIAISYAADRAERRLVSHRTTTRASRQTVIDTYLVNRTVYRHSDQFTTRYGSKWIKRNIAENFTSQFHLSDQLWWYRFILGNATLSDVSRATVDGSDAYVVTADVNMNEFSQAVNERLSTASGRTPNMSIEATFWIDAETHRPLKVKRTVEQTQTVRGQTIEITKEFETTLRYESVSVTLPDGADSAVSIGQ